MATPLSEDSKQLIVTGLQKLQALSATQEEQLAKALKNSGIKLQLDGKTALSIRVFDEAFINKLNSLNDSELKTQKHQIVEGLLQLVQKHQVVFTISHSDQKKEYIFTSEAIQKQFEASKVFTILDEATRDTIAAKAKELVQLFAAAGPQNEQKQREDAKKSAISSAPAPAETSSSSQTTNPEGEVT